jgi:hypothetical protein
VPNRTGRCGWSESRCTSEEVAGGLANSDRTAPTGRGPRRRRRRRPVRLRSSGRTAEPTGAAGRSVTAIEGDAAQTTAEPAGVAGGVKRRRPPRWDRAGRRGSQARRRDVVAVGAYAVAIGSEDLALGKDGNLVAHGLGGSRVPRTVEGAVLAVDQSAVSNAVDHAHGGAHFFSGLIGLVFGARLVLNPILRHWKTSCQMIRG